METMFEQIARDYMPMLLSPHIKETSACLKSRL